MGKGQTDEKPSPRAANAIDPTFEPLPIYLRGYVESSPETEPEGDGPGNVGKATNEFGTSNQAFTPKRTLIFDTETTTDHTQALRVGAYQLRDAKAIKLGMFYDPARLTAREIDTVKTYAGAHGLRLLAVEQFIENIIYLEAYQTGAAIVGFNLPFDLSRLAISSTTARRLSDAFSLRLSDREANPPIQIKNLNSRAALIQFMSVGQDAPRGQRKRQIDATQNRGFFMDVKTGASALFGSRSFSLASLCKFLGTKTQKADTDEHGGPISYAYLDYLMTDVQATWECHEKLKDVYRIHSLTRTGFHRIYSEASVGKAYLKEMGIQSWATLQPDFPRQMLGHIMSAYYGGRAEVRIRRKIARVLYCDFASMYPTICTLMGLWQHFISQGDDWDDSTETTKGFLASVSVEDLQNPTTWRRLATLVEVEPDGEVFPVRAKYDGDANTTIALNHLRSDKALWFTLADCIAAKLLSGRAPRVKRAIAFQPREVQSGLLPILFAGNADYRVDPNEDDLFKRVIELRNEVKAQADKATETEKDQLKATDQALKLFANSTSYGINIEVIVENHSSKHNATLYGIDEKQVRVRVSQEEKQGTNFHPLLAVLITGGARLMLALAETMANAKGLDWALCDTDSMALARPEGMEDAAFLSKGEEIVSWFQRLNPYKGNKPLFKKEAHNFSLNPASRDSKHPPLYCLAISAKRYVLFNIDGGGRPVLRKISGHGLGHLLSPYQGDAASPKIPEPMMDLEEAGVPRWHHDLWYRIVEAQLKMEANQAQGVVRPLHSDLTGFALPAVSRYGASTPRLLAWFKALNAGKSYPDQVKPFNFMYGYQARGPLDEQFDEARIGSIAPSDRKQRHQPHAVAPYDKDRSKALKRVFDRVNGKPVPIEQLQTYEDALADYHLNTESKFSNAGRFDSGRTERRHVEALSVIYIGKEADRLEEAFYLGVDTDIEYLATEEDRAALMAETLAAIKKHGRKTFERACGMAPSHLAAIMGGAHTLTRLARTRLTQAIELLSQEANEIAALLDRARQEAGQIGLRQLARALAVDASNLAKVLDPRKDRTASKALIGKLRLRYQV